LSLASEGLNIKTDDLNFVLILLSYHEDGSRGSTAELVNHATPCSGIILGEAHFKNSLSFLSTLGQLKIDFCLTSVHTVITNSQ
jgi:hypothetical protein